MDVILDKPALDLDGGGEFQSAPAAVDVVIQVKRKIPLGQWLFKGSR